MTRPAAREVPTEAISAAIALLLVDVFRQFRVLPARDTLAVRCHNPQTGEVIGRPPQATPARSVAFWKEAVATQEAHVILDNFSTQKCEHSASVRTGTAQALARLRSAAPP